MAESGDQRRPDEDRPGREAARMQPEGPGAPPPRTIPPEDPPAHPRPAAVPGGPAVPLELTIEGLAFGGEGIARHDGKVRFVRGALPGEVVLAVPMSRRRSYDRMRLVRVVHPSPQRRPPLCPHTTLCGGCALQELEYEAQLAAKAAQVRESLERIGHIETRELAPPLASPRLTRYRNKMEFTFAPRPWIEAGRPDRPPPGPALGLHVPGRFDAVFDLEECVLCSPACVSIVREVRAFARAHGLAAWRSDDDSGLLRHLIVREGMNTGEILAGLVTREEHPDLARLGPLLAERVPGLAGLVLIVNRAKAAVARGEEEHLLHGRGVFRETLAGLQFELSIQSFFQTNTPGAERLVEAAREMLAGAARASVDPEGSADEGGARSVRATGPPRTLLDLYCGAGTFGLALAGSFDRVVGVEQVASAVSDARRNAERNGIVHAEFIEQVVETWLARPEINSGPLAGEETVVLVDPPRTGLHPKAIPGILGLGASTLLYVSCNPTTLARDAALLVAGGYRPAGFRVVDMFPHTSHVESILLLERPA